MKTRSMRQRAWAIALALAPALAMGADSNLLVKAKPLPAGQSYVLFSVSFDRRDLKPFETPCVTMKMVPLTPAAGGKKPRAEYLSTTTGLHCNTAWKTEAAVVKDGDLSRVVILAAIQPGEYEIHEASVQFSSGNTVFKSDPGVAGFGGVKVAAGQMAYAGNFAMLQSRGRVAVLAQDNRIADEQVLRALRGDLQSVEIVSATWVDPDKR